MRLQHCPAVSSSITTGGLDSPQPKPTQLIGPQGPASAQRLKSQEKACACEAEKTSGVLGLVGQRLPLWLPRASSCTVTHPSSTHLFKSPPPTFALRIFLFLLFVSHTRFKHPICEFVRGLLPLPPEVSTSSQQREHRLTLVLFDSKPQSSQPLDSIYSLTPPKWGTWASREASQQPRPS